MTGSYDLLKPGFSKYHHIGLVVPILAATVPFLVAPWFHSFERQHHVLAALALGLFSGILAFVLFKWVPLLKDDHYTLNKAVLLGLLTAEIMIFTFPFQGDWDDRFISPTLLLFFLFMYTLGISEVEES